MCVCVTLLYSKNEYNIANQLYSNNKIEYHFGI